MSTDLASLRRRATEVTRGRPAPVATALYFLAYAATVVTGQSFSVAYLDFGWQIVPWTILRDDPIGSVWNLHIQPPLWNLALGLLAKLSPLSDALTLRLFMLAIGLALVWMLVLVVHDLGVSAGWSIVLVLAMTLNPEVLHNVYEPTYELAVALLLVVSVRMLQRLVDARRGRHLVGLSAAVSALVLTRSLYHPVLIPLILVAGWLFVRRTVTRRQVLASVGIPLVLVGGWLVKNQVMFGEATMSSWVGMNLQRSTIPILDRDSLDQMYARGEVSDIALIGPFDRYDDYAPFVASCEPEHDHPALTVKGHVDAQGVFISNFNYECYLPLYAQAADDFWAVARAHPDVWWQGRVFSMRMTFATSSLPGASGSPLVRALDEMYRLPRLDLPAEASTIGWGSPLYGEFDFPFRFSLSVAILYGLLVLYAAAILLQAARRKPLPLGATTSFAAVSVFAAFLGAFTVVVGVVGELGEQARFRSVTDPICLSVGLLVAIRLLRSWLGGRAPAERGATGRV